MSLRRKYDPDTYYKKVEEILDVVTEDEALAWFNHPCTKSLIFSLEGDFAGLLLMWVGGGYSSEESVDATAQQQAKARGQLQAIDDVIERIQEIRDIRKGGENDEN